MYGRPSHPLPHPELMIDYLDLYPVYRKDRRTSYFNAVKYGYEVLASKITGKAPVDDQLDDMVKKRREDMEDASSFEDWYRLIFDLRSNAEAAQLLKYDGDESVLRNTFHACANLIIDELEKCEFDPSTEDHKLYKNVLAKKIAELEDKASLKVIEIAKNRQLQKDNTKPNADYNKIVLELAKLGVSEYVNIAMQHKLLPTLNIPQQQEMKELGLTSPPVDMAVPIVLHRKQGEWFYRFKYQPSCKHISFAEFRRNAIEKAEERIKSSEENMRAISLEKLKTTSCSHSGSDVLHNEIPDKQSSNIHGNPLTNATTDRAMLKNSEGTISNSTTSTELTLSKGNTSQNHMIVTECKDCFFNTTGTNLSGQSKEPAETHETQKIQTPIMVLKQ